MSLEHFVRVRELADHYNRLDRDERIVFTYLTTSGGGGKSNRILARLIIDEWSKPV